MKLSTAIALLGISSPFVLADNATYKGSVTVINEAPMNGTCVTPIWIGIHDGTFDTYTVYEPIPDPFEALAEDGNNVPVREAFAAANGTIWDGVVGQEPLCPGDNATLEFEFEAGKGTAYYFSYAAMILPSNDAWVSKGDPQAYPVIDETTAEFLPVAIDVAGSDVLDAGTEIMRTESLLITQASTLPAREESLTRFLALTLRKKDTKS